MAKQDLISIIIPIYKVEKYLDKCVTSILNQSYQNLEIILVDDGSPDGCPAICDEFAKKDKRIKVIHKTNGGLSDARNVGIESASGKYIAFVDSDDFVNKYYVETLYNTLIETGADLSICDYVYVKEDEIVDTNEKLEPATTEVFEGAKKFEQIYLEKGVRFVVAWNKLYKSEIFKNNDVRYPIGKIHEDEFIIHEVLNVCKKVSFTSVPLYYYLIREGSIMNQTLSEKNIPVYSALEKRVLFFKEKYPELLSVSLTWLLSKVIRDYFKYNKELKTKVNQIFKNLKQTFKYEIKHLPLKQKLKLFIFSHFKFVLGTLYSIKK